MAVRVLYLQLPVADYGYDYGGADHPLAGGLLAANALSRGIVHEPLFLPNRLSSYGSDPLLVSKILEQKPDILVVTLYLWNLERSVSIVHSLKQIRPDLIVFAGGPESAAKRDNPQLFSEVDWIHEGEGEAVFATALQRVQEQSIPFRSKALPVLENGITPVALNDLTSPYLTGLLSVAPDNSVWVETMRGCPFGCLYCFYGKTFKELRHFPDVWVEQHLRWAAEHSATEVYLLDPSFQLSSGLATRLEQLAKWNPCGIKLHTEARVENIDDDLAALFKRAHFSTIETGLQSIHPKVLAEINRHHSLQGFVHGAQRLKAQGIDVQIDIMLGLPQDSPEGFLETVDFLVRHGLDSNVAIYPLQCLPGTPMRQRASEWSLRFQPLPPYQILGSPTFEETSLRDCLAEAERRLDVSMFEMHLPNLTSVEGGKDWIGLFEINPDGSNTMELPAKMMERLVQCPVFLFDVGSPKIPWEKIRAFSQSIFRQTPTLMPFFGLQVEHPFSIAELKNAILAMHQAKSFNARLYHLAPDPALQLSFRFFVLSGCTTHPDYWLELSQLVPVIRRCSDRPQRCPDDPLRNLAVFIEHRRPLEAAELKQLSEDFRNNPQQVLFADPGNARRYAKQANLPIFEELLNVGSVRLGPSVR